MSNFMKTPSTYLYSMYADRHTDNEKLTGSSSEILHHEGTNKMGVRRSVVG
jgi:hypothetical protein